ncbi:MAG: hypothetical protein BHW57_03310 [Azospirillum sp. 47_25]|nr:MAG: hypothetical protein BHW57_03310 [Azospirillum sp. 47_25]
MKYSVFLGAAACVSVLTCNAYAQTCGAQPSCADLGYTYTGSTSDCLSPALKCPFNTSYFNCTKKADTFYQFKLNWSAAGNISGKTNWTAYQNGIIIGQGQDIGNYGSFITINGRKIGSLTGIAKQRTFFYANVSKGDTLYIDANDVSAVFIPYYGN